MQPCKYQVSVVAVALFNLHAPFGTVFFCLDKNHVHLVVQHCLLKVANIYTWLMSGKINITRRQAVICYQGLCQCALHCWFCIDLNAELFICYLHGMLGILYEVPYVETMSVQLWSYKLVCISMCVSMYGIGFLHKKLSIGLVSHILLKGI
jgi:hypothetical protein